MYWGWSAVMHCWGTILDWSTVVDRSSNDLGHRLGMGHMDLAEGGVAGGSWGDVLDNGSRVDDWSMDDWGSMNVGGRVNWSCSSVFNDWSWSTVVDWSWSTVVDRSVLVYWVSRSCSGHSHTKAQNLNEKITCYFLLSTFRVILGLPYVILTRNFILMEVGVGL